MSEKWKQKILLIFPFAVLVAGMILTAAFFLFQTTDAGIYMNVVDNDPVNDGQVFFYQRLLVFGKLKVLLHPASPPFRQHARMYTPEPADRGK